ncbi:MAG TPA: NADH-quinone oxidoreductase subunit N [Chryseolinea sp.]|nr:NADH-quinone oxidoreductase subunit N [Chryseolinea sp.]HPM31156.1 NADH-quinone oxidoreductase subunit N [Chryseolinea sp.]
MEVLSDKLELIRMSISFFIPELILIIGIILIILIGLIKKENKTLLLSFCSLVIVALSFWFGVIQTGQHTSPVNLFVGMIRVDGFSTYLKLLMDAGTILTVLMTCRRQKEQQHLPEYYVMILAVLLGSHLLVMSKNLIMVFLSLELISISSYVLTGFSFSRKGSEGGLKYFLFGSIASAVMLYGFSLLYGLTGSLDFSSFIHITTIGNSPLFLIGGFMALVGFFYKIAAAPLHPWSPDVYEAAPMPVVAFFSVIPKLAGIGILTKFILTLSIISQPDFSWQVILCAIAILSLTVGNFSALWQKNVKRLMAYSSIAQSGFLLIGVAALLPQGIHYMLFYATVYMIMNFLVFVYLQQFESHGMHEISSFSGAGRSNPLPFIFMLIGFISLIGLPPTAGFTGKLFIFSSLWESLQQSGHVILLLLFIFGLLNTIVSLFYYLRIPYYAFIKNGESNLKTNIISFENLLGIILVIGVLYLFFNPGLLMGWINKINFTL